MTKNGSRGPSLLRVRAFRQLFLADTLSQLGAEVAPVALPLVAVLALEATPFEVGLLTTFETLAFLLVGLPAGAWVDRLRRRNVLIAADLARAALLATVPLAWWAGLLTMGQLFVVGLLMGAATVFFDTAYQSYLPSIIERRRLVEANARLQAVQSVAHVAGPGLGGLLIQLLTAPFALVATVVGNLWSALFLRGIPSREAPPQRTGRPHLGREIMEGLRFLLAHALLRRIMMCTATFNLFWSMSTPMLMLMMARELGLSAGVIGIVLAFGGAGGILGALLVNRVVARLGQGPALWAGVVAAGLAGALLAMGHSDWRLVLVCLGQLIAAFGMVVYNVSQVSFRQSITPLRLLGRVNATGRFTVWGTMPFGGFLSGVLGSTVGPRTTLWVAALGMTLSFLWIYISPMRRMHSLPTAPEAVTMPQN
ncbi:MFS transporter [Streptomyces platensis subsp. clarensis]|nr:MFS transporter [Streptomyces platensis subsp. clarensis]